MVGSSTRIEDAHGVEPICNVLPIAPSTYYDHLAKRADPRAAFGSRAGMRRCGPRSGVSSRRTGASTASRKVWHQMRREGFDVARCTVARLMKDMGIQGIIRGKPHRTTIPDKKPHARWTR
jgi:putative transposase